jgi:hypothetical protein
MTEPTLPCPEPEFGRRGQTWTACQQCGRLAWDHEQSDPLEDIRNVMRRLDKPPAMLSEAEWRLRQKVLE